MVTFGYVAIGCWALFSFVEKTDKFVLPLPGWFPWEINNFRRFLISGVYQLVAINFACGNHLSYDSIICGYGFLIIAYIKNLGIRVAKV